MSIQWFPGHMAKTLKEIEQNLKAANAIIYCLDSRAPKSCLNPEINKIVANKPIVYVLNKSDLADETKTKKFKQQLESEGKNVIITNANSNSSRGEIIKALKAAFNQKIEQSKKKGVNFILRAMVIGVPNTGKSTIINLLAGQKKATTGDKAGVTKQTSWIKVGENVELMDTPGTLWPSFEDERVGRNLAIIGSINDNTLDLTELSVELIKLLSKIAPQALINRYKLNYSAKELENFEYIEILDQICLNRGFILKKNEMDYDRAGKAIIEDYRSLKLGRITLDEI